MAGENLQQTLHVLALRVVQVPGANMQPALHVVALRVVPVDGANLQQPALHVLARRVVPARKLVGQAKFVLIPDRNLRIFKAPLISSAASKAIAVDAEALPRARLMAIV